MPQGVLCHNKNKQIIPVRHFQGMVEGQAPQCTSAKLRILVC